MSVYLFKCSVKSHIQRRPQCITMKKSQFSFWNFTLPYRLIFDSQYLRYYMIWRYTEKKTKRIRIQNHSAYVCQYLFLFTYYFYLLLIFSMFHATLIIKTFTSCFWLFARLCLFFASKISLIPNLKNRKLYLSFLALYSPHMLNCFLL